MINENAISLESFRISDRWLGVIENLLKNSFEIQRKNENLALKIGIQRKAIIHM